MGYNINHWVVFTVILIAYGVTGYYDSLDY